MKQWIQRLVGGVILVPFLYVNFLMYMSGHILIAISFLIILLLGTLIYTSRKGYVYRYLFPGLLGFMAFVIFPLVYTVWTSAHKYDARNLLTYERIHSDFLSQTYRADDAPTFNYELIPSAKEAEYHLLLRMAKEDEGPVDKPPADFVSGSFPITVPDDEEAVAAIPVALLTAANTPKGEALQLRDITRNKLHVALRGFMFALPDGTQVSMTGLRSFAARMPLWKAGQDNTLINQQDGMTIHPDRKLGFFVDEQGEPVGYGFRTLAGARNYRRIFTDERIKGPFLKIFIWTMTFALLSVVTTFAIGMFLAVLLEWKHMKGRNLYRTLLILPYAVPAFLSILTFQGMFNQEFGAVNEFMSAVFNVAPDWNTNAYLAKLMILIVNLWLGYPYMMIICTGNLQSIPDTIYEASAIDGSGPITNFRRLTLPLVLPSMLPVLIASFAFNFNNFNLIFLLTQGRPKMVGGTGVAGETDILVSYTFNLAFKDSGTDYGLASAIATILFIIVGTLAWINLKKTQGSK
jgi:maltose/maltodextrin transport system permease protein